MRFVKVTAKGQVTIPVSVREALGIDDGTYLEVQQVDDEVRLRKVASIRPLGENDPIWRLAGAGAGGAADVAENHDRYLADAEVAGWRESS